MYSKDRVKIVAVPNRQKRTFTIRVHYKDSSITKFRTFPMSIEEFKSSLYHTQNDWYQFMKSNDYYLVK